MAYNQRKVKHFKQQRNGSGFGKAKEIIKKLKGKGKGMTREAGDRLTDRVE